MKKVLYFISALALVAGFSACNKDDKKPVGPDIVLDGFYIRGDAVGTNKTESKYALSAGVNEVEKATRSGMYEKYVWLEANKDFTLVENSAGNVTYYGADLKEVNYGYDENDPDCKNFADNPNMMIQQGFLVIGESAPKMQVKETGLYHIVLDNNKLSDLPDGAQIIVQKADWGVRGGMNSWGFTEGTQTVNNDGTVTWTWEDQDLASNGEFKFASCDGWKINLDQDGKVKAEVSFGADSEGKLGIGNDYGNMVVEKAGLYKLTLTYNCKGGAIADSFTYTVEMTQASTLPETMYIIGNDFGNWDWASDGVVDMVPVHSHGGEFWAVRYMTTETQFKFCSEKAWGKDFKGLGNDKGYITPDNCQVEADGLYLIYVDLVNNAVTVEPANIQGMGDCFDNWDADTHPFTVEGNLATVTLPKAGNLRMFASTTCHPSSDWWQMEFNIYDGKIVYRAAGGEQAAVPCTAGQTVSLDFNAGTATIK